MIIGSSPALGLVNQSLPNASRAFPAVGLAINPGAAAAESTIPVLSGLLCHLQLSHPAEVVGMGDDRGRSVPQLLASRHADGNTREKVTFVRKKDGGRLRSAQRKLP